jgi:hypothetical protein
MTMPLIHGKRRTISASSLLTALGDDIGRIKAEDGLTWDDVGRVLGKSPDQAAKYADATAEMGVTAFYFAKREWGGRFTGSADRMVEQGSIGTDARRAESDILRCALAISQALADGELSIEEVRDNRPVLEAARDAINGQLARLVKEALN